MPNGNEVAYTGGKPKADWSGLVTPRSPENPKCVRFQFGSSDESKAHSRRTQGIDKAFKKSGDFESYCITIGKHIRGNGMDTTLFVPSITDSTKMIFVPEEFQQVTFSHVSEKVQDLKENHWDSYDKANDAATCEFLENGLDPDLLEQLRLRQMDTDTAAETFMRIVRLVQDQSAERFNRLRDSLKALSPVKESGQDVVAYCDKARPICKQLYRAGQWEWILLLPIVKALASVSVAAFSSFFTTLIMKVDEQIKEVFHLDRKTAMKLMTNKSMHFEWFFDKAEDMYRSLKDNNEWGPANMPTGSKNSHQLNFASWTDAQFNSFVQSQVDKKLSEIKKKTKGQGKDDKNGKSTATSNKEQDTNDRGLKWREVAPKDGEPLTKTKNNKTYKWCKKCRRGEGLWHNHSTEEHAPGKGIKKNSKKSEETTSANFGMESDVGLPWSV